MHMQKKITHKEDGRFLVYYHFPDTATPEETQVFENIDENDERGTMNAERNSDSSLLTPHSSLPHTGGATNV